MVLVQRQMMQSNPLTVRGWAIYLTKVDQQRIRLLIHLGTIIHGCSGSIKI